MLKTLRARLIAICVAITVVSLLVLTLATLFVVQRDTRASLDDRLHQLTQTHASLVRQYQALLATEGVTVEFQPEGITRLAQLAFDVNERTENIGARRLSTVMERLLDDVSFDAASLAGQTVSVDAAYVNQRLGELAQDEDLSRYIL